MISTVIILLLIAYGCAMTFGCFNMIKKVEFFEDTYARYETYVRELQTTIHEGRLQLEEMDEKGWFRTDDAIGTYYKGMVELQTRLNLFAKTLTHGGTEEKERE